MGVGHTLEDENWCYLLFHPFKTHPALLSLMKLVFRRGNVSLFLKVFLTSLKLLESTTAGWRRTKQAEKHTRKHMTIRFTTLFHVRI